MENYLHKKLALSEGDVITVTLNQHANVLLLTDADYQSYCSGDAYQYQGGAATESTYSITAPYSGAWNLVLDLGGKTGVIEYEVNITRGS